MIDIVCDLRERQAAFDGVGSFWSEAKVAGSRGDEIAVERAGEIIAGGLASGEGERAADQVVGQIDLMDLFDTADAAACWILPPDGVVVDLDAIDPRQLDAGVGAGDDRIVPTNTVVDVQQAFHVVRGTGWIA